MFGKNLKYYRLKNNMTKRELAFKCNLTPMAITNYENEDRRPNMETIKLLAQILGVKVMDFLIVRNEGLRFQHGAFKKSRSLSLQQQEYARESVEEYFSRFYNAVEILGGEVLPAFPILHKLRLLDNVEKEAVALRKHLGFAVNGPIVNLIGALENKGVLVYLCDIGNAEFRGINGLVNGRPYIMLNKTMTDERIRSTLMHELAHLMFIWPKDMEPKAIEERATAIAAAVLFSEDDAKRELGFRRKSVTKDMLLVCQEYGISLWLLVKKAELCNIITASTAKEFYVRARLAGWKDHEPTRSTMIEKPMLFEQLVYRAIGEEAISIQKGAELLHLPYTEVEDKCCFAGEV